MVYLHKSVFHSHGYLSSANCHVDSRWVLKIAGFALHAFRKQDCLEPVLQSIFKTRVNLLAYMYHLSITKYLTGLYTYIDNDTLFLQLSIIYVSCSQMINLRNLDSLY